MKNKKSKIIFLSFLLFNIYFYPSLTCANIVKGISSPGKIDASIARKYRMKKKITTAFASVVVAASILAILFIAHKKMKKKANLLASLPGEIREKINSSGYDEAYELLTKYRQLGGQIRQFSPAELFSIYYKTRNAEDLLKEELGSNYFSAFCKQMVKEKDYSSAYQFYLQFKSMGGDTRKDFSADEILDIYLYTNQLGELKKEGFPAQTILNLVKKLSDLGKPTTAIELIDKDVLNNIKHTDESDIIVEIYDRADKIKELINNPWILSSNGSTLFVKSLVTMDKYQEAKELLEKKKKKSSDDYGLLISILDTLDKLDEIPFDIPKNYHSQVIELLEKKNKYEYLMKFLSNISETEWSSREYKLWFDICIKKGLRDTAVKSPAQIKNRKDADAILDMYYKLGLELEEERRIDDAVSIYRRFVNENVFFKDILERYIKLSGAQIPSGTIKRMPAYAQTQTGQTEQGAGMYIGKKYEFICEIGRGGMGIVYESLNKEINKKVAIKKMKEEIAINPREKKRFLEESRRVAELHHPNIVDIYDMFEEGGNVYLVFEYVDGETVDILLNRKERLGYPETIKIIMSVCEALKYAHNKRIIHRDLKPSNIMVSQSSWVKVMDFGIARELKDTLSRLTGKDTSGTLAYMAPEQHLGTYDVRSDIYSLGCTMYEMLTGDPPFKGPDFLAQKERMVYRQPTEIVPELPGEINEVIKKCLDKDAENRYHSAEDFMNEIKRIK